MRTCIKCNAAPVYGPRYSYCKSCQSAFAKAWRRTHAEELKVKRANRWKNTESDVKADRRLRARYGITLADYEAMLIEQDGACKICQQKPVRMRLSVDHCHATGKVRGLLCERCNSLLGRVRDDAGVLERAAEYLRKSK